MSFHGKEALDFRKEEYDKFIDEKFKQWIRTHEKALKRNGSNGHYVGNKVSDIKTAVAIGYEDVAELVNKETTPSLWKVRETVLEKKNYRDWLNSKVLKATTGTQSFFNTEYNQL
ncbi:hypothetical protein BGZ65_009720 [Modicella reniformis]|uniref:Uncharacterized protein n=1 Tax=Modicella reniformis TaxID=1440133 RepID=A0A9P6IMZ4_9FUNG|nr:hypothetical protein BGZ65_009720 [Modicella reniformis]